MKIYAKQVPPEYQESPLTLANDEMPENVFLFGNRHYKSYDEELVRLCDYMVDAWNILEELRAGDSNWTWEAHINSLFERDPKLGPYTRQERLKWVNIIERYMDKENMYIVCEALELIKGEPFIYATLRGAVQSEWKEVIYPASYGEKWHKCFEMEYFNTGTEWIIHNGEGEPEGPEEIDGYSIYCYGYNSDLIRKEIVEHAGGEVENVVMFEFDGWARSARWKTA